MADIQVAIVPFAFNTATGNQTVTHGSATFTPKLALFFLSNDVAITGDQVTANMAFGKGAADGTREWCCSWGAEDSAGRADSDRSFHNSACIGLRNKASNAYYVVANFVSFGSGSVTFNITTAPGGAIEGYVILFGGADFSCRADVMLPSTTQNGTANPPTAPGFQSDLILFGVPVIDDDGTGTVGNDLNGGFGQCDGLLNQSAFGLSDRDNSADVVASMTVFNSRIGAEFDPPTRTIIATFEVTAISATTFTLTTRDGAPTTQEIGYVAMNLGGGDAWAGVISSLAGTGDKAWTDPGFQPILASQVATEIATANSPQGGTPGSYAAVNAYDGTDDVSIWFRNTDTLASSVTATQIRDIFRYRNPTVAVSGAWSSFDTTGWTINFTTNSLAAGKLWPAWAIGAGGAGPQTIPVGLATETDTAQPITVSAGPLTIAVGQAVEADLAQPLTVSQATNVAVGQASEADLAQPVTVVPGAVTVAVGQATEADLAQPVTVVPGAVTVAVGQAAEADLAQPVTASQGVAIALLQASEADLAQPVTVVPGAVTVAVGQVAEADLAQPVTVVPGAVTVAVGLATEADLAQPVTPQQGQVVVVGQAAEADLAQPVTVVPGAVTVAIGQAAEADLAQPITSQQGAAVAIGQAAEVDVAQPVAAALGPVTVAVGQASEADLAQPVTVVPGALGVPVLQAIEVDLAQPVGVGLGTIIPVNQAVEIDQAQVVLVVPGPVAAAIGQALETDQALPISPLLASLIAQNRIVLQGADGRIVLRGEAGRIVLDGDI